MEQDFEAAARRGGHVVVVVLGDVGRSPRMQYHAVSLAKQLGCAVTLLGYAGEECCDAVQEASSSIRELRIPAFEPPSALPRPLARLVKAVVLAWRLAVALLFFPLKVDVIMAQTPPAIPTLLVVWLAARFHGAATVADWHNLGFTVLEDASRRRHGGAVGEEALPRSERFASAAYRLCERLSGGRFDAHVCVTAALSEWLSREFGVAGAVAAHDKPPGHYVAAASPGARRDLLRKLDHHLRGASSSEEFFWRGEKTASEAFFSEDDAKERRESRPWLVVSSTSWSPDEDFTLLFDALERYEAGSLERRLLLVVTGKGPLRQAFVDRVNTAGWTKIAVRCLWLTSSDYASLLGAADLGICLHSSTSGLDLPMKVVDMFGAGLPVVALRFACVEELIHDGRDGVLVEASGAALHGAIAALVADPAQLARLRGGVASDERWDAMWQRTLNPIFKSLLSSRLPPKKD